MASRYLSLYRVCSKPPTCSVRLASTIATPSLAAAFPRRHSSSLTAAGVSDAALRRLTALKDYGIGTLQNRRVHRQPRRHRRPSLAFIYGLLLLSIVIATFGSSSPCCSPSTNVVVNWVATCGRDEPQPGAHNGALESVITSIYGAASVC